MGTDIAAAAHRDGVGDGTRACCQATLWWPTPVGAEVAAAVCRDGVGDGTRDYHEATLWEPKPVVRT